MPTVQGVNVHFFVEIVADDVNCHEEGVHNIWVCSNANLRLKVQITLLRY